MRRLLALTLFLVAACSSDEDVSVPVKQAIPSRHDELRDGLLADSTKVKANTGYALAYIAHGSSRSPEAVIDSVDVALGAVEYAGTRSDRSFLPALSSVVEKFDTADYLGTTIATARLALLEVEMTRLLGEDRRARAMAHDDAIRANAFGDYLVPGTSIVVRAYSAAPDDPNASGPANVAMLVLKARLFRLTRNLDYRLEARALYAALRDYVPTTLDEEAELAFATSLLFEITGEDRFIAATDATFDAIATRRGAGFDDATCAGCTFHALWSLGYRRGLAGDPY